jgi:predicted nucleic acid-binding protein
LTLVVDASVTVGACGVADGFEPFAGERLAAPPLMWSEARSALHLAMWQGRVEREDAERALSRLEQAPIRRRDSKRLGKEAWRIADELGWGRTYDAEYVALARLLDCRLVTLDARLLRGAESLDFVVGPDQL